MGYVVTISREYGSGGRIIAEKLAKELGVSFYDRNLIELIAEKSGLSVDTVKNWAEMKTSSLLYDAYMFSQVRPLTEEIYNAKARVIKEIAEKEDCVIVETCADNILHDNAKCLNVFIYAPMKEKIKRVKEIYKEGESNIESFIKKKDKRRSSYYDFYSYGKWGSRECYDLMIDSSIGIDCAVAIIKTAVEEKLKK